MKTKISVFFLILAILLCLTVYYKQEDLAEYLSRKMLNDSLSEETQTYKAALGEKVTTCTTVKLQRKLAFGKWRARAYFDNGAELDCIVTNYFIYHKVDPDNGSALRGK